MPDCIDPAMITEEELNQYASRSQPISDRTREHLQQCSACQEEVRWLRMMQVTLDRFDCPTVEALRDFAMDDLPAQEKRDIAEHLNLCTTCSAEVRDFVEVDDFAKAPAESAPPLTVPSFISRIRKIVAAIAGDAAPAFAVRSSPIFTLHEDTSPRIFEAEGLTFTLSILPQGDQVMIYGVLLDEPQPALLARLVSPIDALDDISSQVFAEALIEQGGFKLGPVTLGTYALEILFPEQMVLVTTFEVRIA